MNRVTLSGRLTRDPEVKYTQKGMAWTNTSIAVDRPTKEKVADFFNLVAWDKTAEIMGKYLKKGSKILVEGRLQLNQYEDKNGDKKSTVNVVVDSFEFMDAKPQDSKSNGRSSESTRHDDTYPYHDPEDTPF